MFDQLQQVNRIKSAAAILISALLIGLTVFLTGCVFDGSAIDKSSWMLYKYETGGKAYTVHEYAKKVGAKDSFELAVQLAFLESGNNQIGITMTGLTDPELKDLILFGSYTIEDDVMTVDFSESKNIISKERKLDDDKQVFRYDEKTDSLICENGDVTEYYRRSSGVRGSIFGLDGEAEDSSGIDMIGQYTFSINGKACLYSDDQEFTLEDNEYSFEKGKVLIKLTEENTNILKEHGLETDEKEYVVELSVSYKNGAATLTSEGGEKKRVYTIAGFTDVEGEEDTFSE